LVGDGNNGTSNGDKRAVGRAGGRASGEAWVKKEKSRCFFFGKTVAPEWATGISQGHAAGDDPHLDGLVNQMLQAPLQQSDRLFTFLILQ
jgi:hypothetical protein